MAFPIASTPPVVRETGSRERRDLPRVALDLPVELYLDGIAGTLMARTRDVGIGGLCVLTPTRFALSGLRRLRLMHPASRLTVDVEALWQREAPGEDGFFTGVSFKEPGRDALDPLWDLVSDQTKAWVRFLSRSPQLQGLDLSERIELAQVTRLRTLRVGRRLYTQGQEALGTRSIFVVSEGALVLETRSERHRRHVLARLGQGDVLGGLGALSHQAPFESAIADGDVSLLEISAGALENLQRSNPTLSFRLLGIAVKADLQRLRAAFHRAVDGESAGSGGTR